MISKELVQSVKKNVSELLIKNQKAIEAMLPKHLTAERLFNVAATAMNKNPKLYECNQASLIACIIQGAQLGLDFDTVLGQAFLVPFRIKGVMQCTFMMGYKGLISLAIRNPKYTNVFPCEVCKGDKFEFEYGTKPFLKHLPKETDRNNQKNITHFYALTYFTNKSEPTFIVMPIEEVEKIRKKSKSPDSEMWKNHYWWGGKKTVVKQICKTLDLSPEYRKAAYLDDIAEAGKQKMSIQGLMDHEYEVTDAEPKEDIKPPQAADAPPAAAEAEAPAGQPEDQGNLFTGDEKKGPAQLAYEDYTETMKKHDKKKWPNTLKQIENYCNKISLPMDMFEEKHYTELNLILQGK